MSSQTSSAEALQDTRHPRLEPIPSQVIENKNVSAVTDGVSIQHSENNSSQPQHNLPSGPSQTHSPVYTHGHGTSQTSLANPPPNRTSGASPAATSGGKSQTVFIHKLYDMLEDSSLSHLIWWTASEDSFCLFPGEEFSNVLAQYFKHTNIASFIRQLNMYGFHKVNESFQSDDKHSTPLVLPPGQTPAPKWEFRHSANQFRKGDVESLSLIKRKSLKLIQSHKEIVSLKSIPPTSDAPVDVDHTHPLAPAHAQIDQHNAALANQQQQYHRALVQQQWDQPTDGSGTPSPKLPPRQPIYPQAILPPHAPYTHFQGPVLSMPVPFSPHLPCSPPPHEQPAYANPLPLRLDSRQTSDPTSSGAMDHAVNVKLLELNGSISTLKTNYKDLLSKYDSLYALFQRSQSDLLQLTEVLERTLQKAEKKDESEEAIKRDDESSDRLKTRTPIDRCKTPVERKATNLSSLHDQGTLPMSGKTQHTRVLELSTFRAQLLRKINAPPLRSQKNSNSLLSYHLHEHPQNLPKITNYNIVPQQYPLNPNYGLYSSSEGGIRRQVSSEEALKVLQPAPNRHVSVLMDPLQPSPAHVLVKEEKPKDRDASLKPPVAERTPSIVSHSGQTPYVQQYQPLALQANPLYYQHYQMRTASLPVVSNLLPPKFEAHAHQRYSLTNIPDHRSINSEPDSMRHMIVSNSSSAPQTQSQALTSNPSIAATLQLPEVNVQGQGSNQQTTSGANGTGSAVNASGADGVSGSADPVGNAGLNAASGSVGSATTVSGILQNGPILAKPISELSSRNQLPSMEELNKSLRVPSSSSRLYDMITSHDDDNAKRRKFEI